MILLPLGLMLAVIATVYIVVVSLFECGIKWDRLFVGIGITGCLMMIAGIFTLHPALPF